MQLSAHFTLAEATRSDTAQRLGISNQPDARELRTLKATAERMEQVRELLGGNPILVSSWFRSAEVHRAVGGVPNSSHRTGQAVDFTCPGYGSVTDVCRALARSNVEFDQVIWEYGRWCHIGFAPAMRRQLLQIHTGGGYQVGLP